MNKKIISLIGAILFVAVTLSFAQSTSSSFSSGFVFSNIEILSDSETVEEIIQCAEKHLNGCHAGGKNSINCSIGSSFHTCLGGLGGNCSVGCGGHSYACCGLSCKCIDY